MKRPARSQKSRASITQRRRALRARNRALRRIEKRASLRGETAKRKRFAAVNGIGFDRDLARVQIVLPDVFSLRDNYDQTAEVLSTLRENVLQRNRRVMVHFAHVRVMDPPSALALAAEIHRARNLVSPDAVAGTYPGSRAIYDLLHEMGFFRLLDIRDADGIPAPTPSIDRPIFLPFITANKVEAQLADQFVDIIEKRLIPMNALARGKLVGALIEAMSNTYDHAFPEGGSAGNMKNRWWLSSSLDLVNKEVRVMFFDHGVGIPGTITMSKYESIVSALAGMADFTFKLDPSDGEKILAAAQLYRTSTGQSGRGRGFRDMKRFVAACTDGELRVLSNRGRYSYVRDRESNGDEHRSIGGTLIEWRFRHDKAVEMTDE